MARIELCNDFYDFSLQFQLHLWPGLNSATIFTIFCFSSNFYDFSLVLRFFTSYQQKLQIRSFRHSRWSPLRYLQIFAVFIIFVEPLQIFAVFVIFVAEFKPGHISLLDDKGLLRVGGRLESALIDYEAKHRIVLPYRHRATDLIILQHHHETGHLGQEYVLSSLRHLYWIIRGCSAMWRVIGGCFRCRKLGAVRGEQLMADLPKERLTSGDPPFMHVGSGLFWPTLCGSKSYTRETLWLPVYMLGCQSCPH